MLTAEKGKIPEKKLNENVEMINFNNDTIAHILAK